LNHLANHHAPL